MVRRLKWAPSVISVGLAVASPAGLPSAIVEAAEAQPTVKTQPTGTAVDTSSPTPASRPGEGPLKIGYVNLAKVFDGYARTKSFDAELERRGTQKEAEAQGKRDELKKLSDGLELLSDDARDARARQLEEKRDELQRFVNGTARDLRRERDRIAKEILQEIQTAIDAYAKAKGFSVVLDERSLLYGQSAYDVTDDVLTLLNSRAGKPRSP